MTQDKLLQRIGELIGSKLAPIEMRLDQMEKNNAENFRAVRKDIRGLKLKASKTWKLLEWFTKDADIRIVGNTRRIEDLEKTIKHN